ncbi:MAG: hypothetical protein WC748_05380 [Legionellales bacterium]|jgi:hypothetical protein
MTQFKLILALLPFLASISIPSFAKANDANDNYEMFGVRNASEFCMYVKGYAESEDGMQVPFTPNADGFLPPGDVTSTGSSNGYSTIYITELKIYQPSPQCPAQDSQLIAEYVFSADQNICRLDAIGVSGGLVSGEGDGVRALDINFELINTSYNVQGMLSCRNIIHSDKYKENSTSSEHVLLD